MSEKAEKRENGKSDTKQTQKDHVHDHNHDHAENKTEVYRIHSDGTAEKVEHNIHRRRKERREVTCCHCF